MKFGRKKLVLAIASLFLISILVMSMFSQSYVINNQTATLNTITLAQPKMLAQPKNGSPVKVLVIDWMSDPTLEYLNTLVNTSFDEAYSFTAVDLNPLSGDDHWDITNYRVHSGIFSMWCAQVGDKHIDNRLSHMYDDEMDTELIVNTNLFGYNSATLSFWYWLNTEPSNDWFSVEARRSPLDPWTVLANYTGNSGDWQYANISLNDFCGEFSVAFQVRFRFWSGSANSNYEGVYIDDVNIIAKDISDTYTLIDENFETVPVGSYPITWQPPTDWNPLNNSDYWGASDYRAHSGSISMWCAQVGDRYTINSLSHTYDNDMDAQLLSPMFNLWGRSSATLSFWYWLDTEPQYDWLAVQLLPIAGGEWETLANYTGNSGGWQYASISLDTYCGNLSVWIRFLFHSNPSNAEYEGAYIDDVKVTASPYKIMDNSREISFWTAVNSSPDFNVVIKPPRILDYEASFHSILSGGGLVTKTGIQQYIEEIQPDVIVLDDVYLDMFGVWGFNSTERLAIFNYIEQGHGLILTGGSLFDMRANNTLIGPYGNINRLYLEQSPNLEELRNNYRSSLVAACGLGLLPIYEEAREWIANYVQEIPEVGTALSYIVRSVPLMPTAIPFNSQFTVKNTDDPLLQGISGDFSINLDSKGCYANGTTVGWQLEYPEIMAINAINTLNTVIGSIVPTLNSTVSQALTNTTNCIKNYVSNYVAPELVLSTEQFNDIMNNVTDSMTQMLMNLYETRLSSPNQFTVPIKFNIGPVSIDTNITIPIPVEIQEVVIPATIVAESSDGLAAVLRYEAGNHRAVYFSFKPSLEIEANGPCKQLMENALRWASQAPVLPETGVIANLRIPKTLIDQARTLLNLSTSVGSKYNTSDTIHEGETYSYILNLDASDCVVVYWYGLQAQVNASLGDSQITATKISNGSWHAAIITVHEDGAWNITIRMDEDDPLLTPLAIEVISKSSEGGIPPVDFTTAIILLALTQQKGFPMVYAAAIVAVIVVAAVVGVVLWIRRKT